MIDYVSISSTKLKDLFDKGGADCVAMWMKYAYHCKRQKTNQIKATQSFMENGMNWGTAKTRKIKHKLEELGYIEQIVHKSDAGLIVDWFIKINHLPRQSTLAKIDTPHAVEKPTSGESDSQMLKGDKGKYLKVNNWETSFPQDVDSSNTNVKKGEHEPELDNFELRYTEPLTFEEVDKIAEIMTRYPITHIDTNDQRQRTIEWAKNNNITFNSRQHFINSIRKGLENWYLKKLSRSRKGIYIQNDGWATEQDFASWNRKVGRS